MQSMTSLYLAKLEVNVMIALTTLPLIWQL